jgi:adenosylhomocysteine nucleosidase
MPDEGLVVILTALNLEYAAVRDRLTDLTLHRHRTGTRFEVGRFAGGAGRAALALTGKGTHPAAVLAERAIAEFAPVAVLFVGVAGALRPSLPLGDVVVATHVYAYHGGTSEDGGLRVRPRVWETAHAADQLARHVDRVGDWRHQLPPGVAPGVRFGPIAAGEIVQNSAVSAEAEWIRTHYSDALAIEMEAAGVAQAGHLNQAPVVIVRGLSDRADGTKQATDAEHWQPRAARHAAAFATALAQALIQDAPATPHPTAGNAIAGSPTAGDAPAGTWNYATGDGIVAVQAGQIYGDIHLSAGAARPSAEAPSNVPARLTNLRARLHQVRQSGQLDDLTATAAEHELDAATAALAVPDWGTVLLSLRRLSGLAADAPDLAAPVTALIALVKNHGLG